MRETTFDLLEAARSLLLYECLQPAHDDDWIGVTLATSSIAVGAFAQLTAHLDDRDRARDDADALLVAATGAWLAVHDRMVDRPTIDSAVDDLLRLVEATAAGVTA
jgi:hypothetical protein